MRVQETPLSLMINHEEDRRIGEIDRKMRVERKQSKLKTEGDLQKWALNLLEMCHDYWGWRNIRQAKRINKSLHGQ